MGTLGNSSRKAKLYCEAVGKGQEGRDLFKLHPDWH